MVASPAAQPERADVEGGAVVPPPRGDDLRSIPLDAMTSGQVVIGVGGTLGHDANAALLVDGRLIAASQEERYSRQKYDAAFPEQAIRDCLSFVNQSLSDVDVCVFADKPLQEWLSSHFERPSNWLTWQLGRVAPPRVSRARRVPAACCHARHCDTPGIISRTPRWRSRPHPTSARPSCVSTAPAMMSTRPSASRIHATPRLSTSFPTCTVSAFCTR